MKPIVIIPTYNYAPFILRAIESVKGAEIIVIDDGSTDNTTELLQPLIDDDTITYHYQPNAGKAAATRKGIEMASGETIFTLDADDWFLPGKIANTLEIFKQHPEVVHVASPAQIVWENQTRSPEREPVPHWLLGKPLDGLEVLEKFYNRNRLYGGGSTFAARASVLKKMPLPDAVDMYTDEWLVLYALMQGKTFFLEDAHSAWYVHENNYSGKGGEALEKKIERLKRSSNAILRLIRENGFPESLVKAYTLKDRTRKLFWAEQSKSKSLMDVIEYAQAVLRGKYSWESIQQYHVVNRMIKFW